FIHTWLRFGEIMRGSLSARQFFSEHPEYISSAELEQKLYREFAQVTTVPAYKEMSMYQLLVISQDRLTH
ncbi:hypothetical protein FSF69_020530, partial [Escherichia coli]|nr:hypothetical protein [Escherichia coli]